MKAVQYFDKDYLEQSRKASTEQILHYLEQFRLMQSAKYAPASKSRLISLKVADDLLTLFRAKCEVEGVKYQTQIKKLMSEWVEKSK